jgi:hypothetical protein
MGAGWKFVGEFKRGRKASLSLECIVALSDRRAAEGIASKKLVGADTITATELSQAELNTLNIMEGDVTFESIRTMFTGLRRGPEPAPPISLVASH